MEKPKPKISPKNYTNKTFLQDPKDYPSNDTLPCHHLYFPKHESEKKVYFKNKIIRYHFDNVDQIEYEDDERIAIEQFKRLFNEYYTADYILMECFTKFDDIDILRFLYGANFDFIEAVSAIKQNYKLLMKYHTIRKDVIYNKKPVRYPNISHPLKPKYSLLWNDSELDASGIYIFGRDSSLRLIIHVNVSKYVQVSMCDNEINFPQLCIVRNYIMDQSIPGQIENYVIIFDHANNALVNFTGIDTIKRLKEFFFGLSLPHRSRVYRAYHVNTGFIGKYIAEQLSNNLDKRYLYKVKISTSPIIKKWFTHISKYQQEKKFGGYIDNLENNFWPPKTPNRHYWLGENENDWDNYITPEEYYQKYKRGYFDNFPSKICCSLINPFQEMEKEEKTMTDLEKSIFYNSIGLRPKADNSGSKGFKKFKDDYDGLYDKKNQKAGDQDEMECCTMDEGFWRGIGLHRSLGDVHKKEICLVDHKDNGCMESGR